MAGKFESVVVACDLAWAFLNRKNELSDKYTVDLCNLNEDDVAALSKIGLKMRIRKEDHAKLAEREKEGKPVYDRGTYISVKSAGKFFKVWNTNEEELSEEDIGEIGNGTKALVRVSCVLGKNSAKYGPMAGLGDIVITDLVRYSADGISQEFKARMNRSKEDNPLGI